MRHPYGCGARGLNYPRAAIGSQDASQPFSTAGSTLLAFLELITKLNSVTRSAQSIWLARSACALAVGGQAVSAGLSIVESLNAAGKRRRGQPLDLEQHDAIAWRLALD